MATADSPSDVVRPDGTEFPPGGYALTDAPKAYSDPDDWHTLERATDAARGLRRTYGVMTVGGEPIAGWDTLQRAKHKNALIADRERADARVREPFLTKLRTGDLIAMGYQKPLRLDSVPVRIPPDHWRAVAPNFQKSTAKGAGAEYVCVRVYTRQEIEDGLIETQVLEIQRIDPETYRNRRPPGRPSCMPQIESELRRRGAQGKLHDIKIAEFEYLADWARQNCQGADPPSQEWIRKKLGKKYDELIERKKSEKKA